MLYLSGVDGYCWEQMMGHMEVEKLHGYVLCLCLCNWMCFGGFSEKKTRKINEEERHTL